jgi:hypothetical protein
VARTIFLSPEEGAALMRKVNGTGGFQSLLRMLQKSYDKDTRAVRLSDDEIERVVRYTTQYGWGGFEGRLEGLRDKLSKSLK